MISFWRIFSLEFVAFVRSKAMALLLAATATWMLAFPCFLRSDGTAEGAREMYIHYSLGGVMAIAVVSLLAAATAAIAAERERKRLQLALVRPVSRFTIAAGKIAALVSIGAIALALAAVMLAFRVDLRRPCYHVLSPILPSPAEEARLMYDGFMADPETPPAVKKMKKGDVLRLLVARASENYQPVNTNETVTWRFPLDSFSPLAEGALVRLRFTNQMEMRQDLIGHFRLGPAGAAVSNLTQSVLTIPLASSPSAAVHSASADDTLSFTNLGRSSLMLRPRRDLNLLLPADSFAANLLRAYIELVSILALVVAFGVLLSAGLGRPVAMFVAFVTLIVGEMSPSVAEQYSGDLDASRAERIGIAITRFVASAVEIVSAPLSGSRLSPLESLAKDESLEPAEVARIAALDLLVVPAFLALLSALILPHKQDDLV